MVELLGQLVYAWLLLIGGGLLVIFTPVIIFIVIGLTLSRIFQLLEKRQNEK
jgi:hypothetical protein